eukprot:634833-Prymnesium_polylepis.1
MVSVRLARQFTVLSATRRRSTRPGTCINMALARRATLTKRHASLVSSLRWSLWVKRSPVSSLSWVSACRKQPRGLRRWCRHGGGDDGWCTRKSGATSANLAVRGRAKTNGQICRIECASRCCRSSFLHSSRNCAWVVA